MRFRGVVNALVPCPLLAFAERSEGVRFVQIPKPRPLVPGGGQAGVRSVFIIYRNSLRAPPSCTARRNCCELFPNRAGTFLRASQGWLALRTVRQTGMAARGVVRQPFDQSRPRRVPISIEQQTTKVVVAIHHFSPAHQHGQRELLAPPAHTAPAEGNR